MVRADRRSLIPKVHRDLNLWPTLDTSTFDEGAKSKFLMRIDAIKRYRAGEAFSDIKSVTNIGEGEVRRLIKRCLIVFDDGQIGGFRALYGSKRLTDYKRKSAVTYRPGRGPGGYVGALNQLFDQYPELEQLVLDLYLGRPTENTLGGGRKGLLDIHAAFEIWLKDAGLTDSDWPFCTANRGYSSLGKFLKKFRLDNVQLAAKSRSGTDAARRTSVGNGEERLLPAGRPFSFVQLDFHKVDAASIITITNEYGKEFDYVVSRWHIGLIAEERYSLVLGAYICLTLVPSGDDVLEVIESALDPEECKPSDPRCKYVEGGKALFVQLMPDLRYQCFSALKVDNAWSNASHEVVGNIMDAIGCSVNFGPSRHWWRRSVIENLNGLLTRAGLQKLPSTFGHGVTDTRVDDSAGAALKYRIKIKELISLLYAAIHDHNVKPHSQLGWSSPIECMKNAANIHSTGYFYQPVPKQIHGCPLVLWHRAQVRVAGDLEKHVRPYFKYGWVYTNPTLARSFELIGKELTVYISRRKCRVAYAYRSDTGEYLGQMSPGVRHAKSELSLFERRYLNRVNKGGPHHGDDFMAQWESDKKKELLSRPKAQSKNSSKDALLLAKLAEARERVQGETDKHQEVTHLPETSQQEMVSVTRESNPKSKDIFGFDDVPTLRTVVRRPR